MGDPTLLLTRPQSASERFADDCREKIGRDIPIVISPVLEIQPLPLDIDPAVIGTFLFTSENGVASLADQTDLTGSRAICVGDRTANAAGRVGMIARSAGGDVEALVGLVSRSVPEEPLLHVRGVHATGGLANRLAALGFEASEAMAYDQVARGLSDEAQALLSSGEPVVLPIFSPRSAKLIREQMAAEKENLAIVAISPAVAAVWDGGHIVVAKAPDADEMAHSVARLFRTTRLVAPPSDG